MLANKKLGEQIAATNGDEVGNSPHDCTIQQIGNEKADNKEIEQYYTARILAAENKADEAIQSLQLAIDNGFSFYGPVRFDNDPFLKSLFKNEAYKKLVKPK